jgi:hypothetical protein
MTNAKQGAGRQTVHRYWNGGENYLRWLTGRLSLCPSVLATLL